MKKRNITPKKTYWIYILFGVLAMTVAAFLLPLWPRSMPWADWGSRALNLIIAVMLMLYLINYLLPKVCHGGNGPIYMLLLVEFALICVIALGCVLSQFKILNISGTCVIFGLCMLARGTVEIFRAYYHQKDSKAAYPVWWLAVAIFFVICGTYLMVKPLFSDELLLWLFAALLFAYGLMVLFYGVRCKPKKKKQKTTTAKA